MGPLYVCIHVYRISVVTFWKLSKCVRQQIKRSGVYRLQPKILNFRLHALDLFMLISYSIYILQLLVYRETFFLKLWPRAICLNILDPGVINSLALNTKTLVRKQKQQPETHLECDHGPWASIFIIVYANKHLCMIFFIQSFFSKNVVKITKVYSHVQKRYSWIYS